MSVLADEVAILFEGRIVERAGAAAALLPRPRIPTRARWWRRCCPCRALAEADGDLLGGAARAPRAARRSSSSSASPSSPSCWWSSRPATSSPRCGWTRGSRRRRCGALRARHGLDRRCPSATCAGLASLARGELGYSFAYGTPGGPAAVAACSATRSCSRARPRRRPGSWPCPSACGGRRARRRPCGAALSVLTATLLAVPDIVLALVLLLLAVRTGWFPAGGMTSVGHEQMSRAARLRDVASHLVLPASALVLGVLPALDCGTCARAWPPPSTRRSCGPPARTASRNGASLFRHALPAAANPLVSLFGLSLAGLSACRCWSRS